MIKFLAIAAMFVLIALNALGNFYFTYGIWPRSWTSFVIFIATSVTLMLMFEKVRKEL